MYFVLGTKLLIAKEARYVPFVHRSSDGVIVTGFGITATISKVIPVVVKIAGLYISGSSNSSKSHQFRAVLKNIRISCPTLPTTTPAFFTVIYFDVFVGTSNVTGVAPINAPTLPHVSPKYIS